MLPGASLAPLGESVDRSVFLSAVGFFVVVGARGGAVRAFSGASLHHRRLDEATDPSFNAAITASAALE